MQSNELNADTPINSRRRDWAGFFATLEPFDLSEVLKDVRSNDVPRPIDTSWLTAK